MTDHAPLLFSWDGESFHPASQRFAKQCDKEFVVGETYSLVAHEFRSTSSHKHFFASVNEAWKNIPDDIAHRWPTPDHLRRWALIQAGYRNERTIVAGNPDAANEIAAFIEDIDDYAVVVVHGNLVSHCTAKSQSTKAMGKAVFQDSKRKVLDVISNLIGVSADDLHNNADRAA
jgi:hypothetical protein